MQYQSISYMGHDCKVFTLTEDDTDGKYVLLVGIMEVKADIHIRDMSRDSNHSSEGSGNE